MLSANLQTWYFFQFQNCWVLVFRNCLLMPDTFCNTFKNLVIMFGSISNKLEENVTSDMSAVTWAINDICCLASIVWSGVSVSNYSFVFQKTLIWSTIVVITVCKGMTKFIFITKCLAWITCLVSIGNYKMPNIMPFILLILSVQAIQRLVTFFGFCKNVVAIMLVMQR